MYRNSPLDVTERVNFAPSDANEARDYNRGNCVMAARLLNENVRASARAEGKAPNAGVGFLCEPGGYSDEGAVTTVFEPAFPATSDAKLAW
jgi:hypothetical protein